MLDLAEVVRLSGVRLITSRALRLLRLLLLPLALGLLCAAQFSAYSDN